LALRQNSIRTGHVNPESMEAAYRFHKLILEIVPFHLSISPLDVDYLDLMFGFDLECNDNHDRVVYDALLAESPLANLANLPGYPDAKLLDVQPVVGLALDRRGETQAYFEVKTRARGRRGQVSRSRPEPISILLTVRKYGPVESVEELKNLCDIIAEQAERLASDRLVPDLLTPIARQITSSA
jgi:hypothetical protein